MAQNLSLKSAEPGYSHSGLSTVNTPVSVVILTYNEEVNLRACLTSIRDLSHSVFVVDSGSTDRTREIAEAAGATTIEHQFENYAAQRNWALKNLPLENQWVLHLDADERLTPELVSEIREALGVRGEAQSTKRQEQNANGAAFGSDHKPSAINHTLAEIDGFLLRKRTYFMGRWIKHGGHYPSYHLRLFRKEKGFCEERLYDQHFVVNGKVEKLRHDYVDILSSDLNTWTERHMRWADLEAQQLLMNSNDKAQVRPAFFGSPIERKRWLRKGPYEKAPLYVRAFLYWFYRYFLRLGFLDGKEGFIFHFLQGFWFRLIVDIKIDEMRRSQRSEVPSGLLRTGSDQRSATTRDQRPEVRSPHPDPKVQNA